MTTPLAALGMRRAKLLHDLAEVEAQIRDAIIGALRDGEAPTDVARTSTYSAAQVRNLARAAEIAPSPRGRRRAA